MLELRLNCKDLASNKSPTIADSCGSVSLVHKQGDPSSVNRINASLGGLEVEILPSKGFAVGQMYQDGQPLLWNPPIGICDPESLNLLSNEVAINGTPAPGFTFLKTFSAGMEFYGLRNWGMPAFDKRKDIQHPVHGETSNIPVDFCDVEIYNGEISLSTSFVYRDMPHEPSGTWYFQGPELFEVERRVVIRKENPRLQLMDRVTNISQEPLKPDWGYHITFFPSDGSRLLVPSASAENRSGEKVPENFDRWSPAKNNEIREETGIIHKGLKTNPSDYGNLGYVLVTHPHLKGIKVNFPQSPYFQTWFCKGGANSKEFTRVSDGKPLFSRNWDGMGIEFGSSALDHDGNTDQLVPKSGFLEPGSSIEIPLLLDFMEGNELQELSDEIQKNNVRCVYLPI